MTSDQYGKHYISLATNSNTLMTYQTDKIVSHDIFGRYGNVMDYGA